MTRLQQMNDPLLHLSVVFEHKNGKVRIYVDYRELNKCNTKDAYPLPRPDEVQDNLKVSTVFSTLDLRSGYWQLPLHANNQLKTAFCLGPWFGLFQFQRMPFELSRAPPSSFQKMMNIICGVLSFVTTYLHDLVHSKSINKHVEHLEILFQLMHNTGLTFCGSKARLACLCYLPGSHLFRNWYVSIS